MNSSISQSNRSELSEAAHHLQNSQPSTNAAPAQIGSQPQQSQCLSTINWPSLLNDEVTDDLRGLQQTLQQVAPTKPNRPEQFGMNPPAAAVNPELEPRLTGKLRKQIFLFLKYGIAYKLHHAKRPYSFEKTNRLESLIKEINRDPFYVALQSDPMFVRLLGSTTLCV